jgi:hypothetical protein
MNVIDSPGTRDRAGRRPPSPPVWSLLVTLCLAFAALTACQADDAGRGEAPEVPAADLPEGSGGAQEAAAERYASVLDFSDPDHRADQLLYGFFAHKKSWRWVTGKSGVRLQRLPQHTRWRVKGRVDLSKHGVDALSLTVRVNGGEPAVQTIRRSGRFTFAGDLPAEYTELVALDLECDHVFVPADRGLGRDKRSLCLRVMSIGLQ